MFISKKIKADAREPINTLLCFIFTLKRAYAPLFLSKTLFIIIGKCNVNGFSSSYTSSYKVFLLSLPTHTQKCKRNPNAERKNNKHLQPTLLKPMVVVYRRRVVHSLVVPTSYVCMYVFNFFFCNLNVQSLYVCSMHTSSKAANKPTTEKEEN